MRYLVTLIGLCLLSACAQPGGNTGDSAAHEQATKQLHDVWVAPTEKVAIIGGVVIYTMADHSVCEGTEIQDGDESSGTFTVANVVYIAGTGPGDPGCASLNQVLTYTKTATALTLCDPSSVCTTYN